MESRNQNRETKLAVDHLNPNTLTEEQRLAGWRTLSQLQPTYLIAFCEHLKKNMASELPANKKIKLKDQDYYSLNLPLCKRAKNPIKRTCYDIKKELLGEGASGKSYRTNDSIELVTLPNELTTLWLRLHAYDNDTHSKIGNRKSRVIKQFQNEKNPDFISLVRRESIAVQRYQPLKAKVNMPISLQTQITMQEMTGLTIEQLHNQLEEDFFNNKGKSYLLLVIKICLKILYELQKVHSHSNLLHGDIKPDNVFYDPIRELARFIDFGYAIDLQNSADISTPECTAAFASPEQIRNCTSDKLTKLDKKSDVNSTANLLAYLLKLNEADKKGNKAFSDKDHITRAEKHLDRQYNASGILELFKDNFLKEIVKKITDVINKMAKNKLKERIPLTEAIQQFEEIYLDLIKTDSEIKELVNLVYQQACLVREKLMIDSSFLILTLETIKNQLDLALKEIKNATSQNKNFNDPEHQNMLADVFILILGVEKFYGLKTLNEVETSLAQNIENYKNIDIKKNETEIEKCYAEQLELLSTLLSKIRGNNLPGIEIPLVRLFSYLFKFDQSKKSISHFFVTSLDDFFKLADKKNSLNSLLAIIEFNSDREKIAEGYLDKLIELTSVKKDDALFPIISSLYLSLIKHLYKIKDGEQDSNLVEAKSNFCSAIFDWLIDNKEKSLNLEELRKIILAIEEPQESYEDFRNAIHTSLPNSLPEKISEIPLNQLRIRIKNTLDDILPITLFGMVTSFFGPSSNISRLGIRSISMPNLFPNPTQQPTAFPSYSYSNPTQPQHSTPSSPRINNTPGPPS